MAETHLVVLDEFLVAQDVALTLADHDPGAQVLVAADAGEALGRIAPYPRLGLAFVAADPAGFAGSALADALRARGAAVVLVGDGAEEWPGALPWPVLRRPFTAADVAALLRRPKAG